MPGLYTPTTIKKIRQNAEIKRDFLTEMFFKESDTSPTEVIILEAKKSGEMVAPFITPLEAGRPVYSKAKKSNVINAPSIAPEYTLTSKDIFDRQAGETIEGFNPATATGKRIGEILAEQEKYIKNKIELMVSQFLTTGKVKSGENEAAYELDYEMTNKTTLGSSHKWTDSDIEPLDTIDEYIEKSEECGTKTEIVVLGTKAAKLLTKSKGFKDAISRDLQSEFVKTSLRTYPGIVWIGTYAKYGVELFSYSRKVTGPDGEVVKLMPENTIIGGPSQGTIIYAPIIYMGDEIVHMTPRYSNLDKTNPKVAKITTESRPVLQPCDLDAYFSVVVCDAD